MVYLQEAHADDLWPLGYGVQSHRTLEDRLGACKAFLGRHIDFREQLQAVAVDTMDDHFLHTYGAWPERYYLIDVTSGHVTWASTITNGDQTHALQEVLALAGCGL